MRLLAASIVILLLAFSLAHAEEYAGGQVDIAGNEPLTVRCFNILP